LESNSLYIVPYKQFLSKSNPTLEEQTVALQMISLHWWYKQVAF